MTPKTRPWVILGVGAAAVAVLYWASKQGQTGTVVGAGFVGPHTTYWHPHTSIAPVPSPTTPTLPTGTPLGGHLRQPPGSLTPSTAPTSPGGTYLPAAMAIPTGPGPLGPGLRHRNPYPWLRAR